jgi:hypothetical protein
MAVRDTPLVKSKTATSKSASPSTSRTRSRGRDKRKKRREKTPPPPPPPATPLRTTAGEGGRDDDDDDDDDDDEEEEEENEKREEKRKKKGDEENAPPSPAGEWRLTSPGRYACIGPSHSGKSELVIKIVSQTSIWVDRPKQVIYCAPYLEDRQTYLLRLREAVESSEASLHTLDTIPTVREVHNILGSSQPCILILDDILSFDINLRKRLTQLMVMESHHSHMTVILCQQNAFPAGPEFVTCNRNLTGRFILYQLNDWRGIVNINNIIFPGKKNFLPACLTEAKEVLNCNYIFVNSFPFSELKRRHTCYTCLFAEERPSGNKNSPTFFDTERYSMKESQ